MTNLTVSWRVESLLDLVARVAIKLDQARAVLDLEDYSVARSERTIADKFCR